MASLSRRTLAGPAEFKGIGLHSAQPVVVVVKPGDNGIRFHYQGEVIEAKAENVLSVQFRTQLGSVATIEHLMSALAGLGITDAEIETSASEMPALDGSSKVWVQGLLKAGLKEPGELEQPVSLRPIHYVEGDIDISISAGDGHWRYDFVTGDRWPHEQSAEIQFGLDSYEELIAPARTFGFEEEVEPMQAAGLGQGLTLESALVLGMDGYVNEPRFENEPARHKLLDLIGDLALAGLPAASLDVHAKRSGHISNVAAAVKIRQSLGLI
jgi:UDP-3-O-acyl-N-acetylglucosamine deacetylase